MATSHRGTTLAKVDATETWAAAWWTLEQLKPVGVTEATTLRWGKKC